MKANLRLKRQNEIIAICEDMREDSLSGHGIPLTNYDPKDLYQVIVDCMGTEWISDVEKRLAVVVFEEGAEIAKACIWYEK